MSSSEEDSYSMIFASLKHPIRRKILRILSSEAQSFSDLQKQFTIESSHLTYHIDGLGNLLYKTEDGKYALSSLGEAAVSMMRNVEEPPAPMRFPFKPSGKSYWIRPLTFILVCALIASAIFSGIVLYRHNDLANSNNTLDQAYNDLANNYTQLNQAYNGLNNTYSSLKKAYDELQQAYYRLSGGIPFQTIQTNGYLINPAYYVIQNESALNEMWSKLSFQLIDIVPNGTIATPSPPKINFTESILIAVFRGTCPSTGYDITITGIYNVDQSVVVKVEKTNPGRNCVVALMLTYPYDVIIVPRIDRPITFETVEKTLDCP